VPERQTSHCLCPSGSYFFLNNNTCLSYLKLGDLCLDTYECPINSTCALQGATSNKICQCDANKYYQVSNSQCALVKGYLLACSSNVECDTLLGLQCISGYCSCPTTHFYNSVECEVKKGHDALNLHTIYCLNSFECKNNSRLFICNNGECQCLPGETWVSFKSFKSFIC
jgi:hypothetical protein